MRITQNQFSPPAGRKLLSAPKEDRAPQLSAQDLLLMDRIRSQERVMTAAYAMPWTGAAVGAAGAYYLAKTTVLSNLSAVGNHPALWSGGLGLPVGLLLGCGLAEYMSTNAAARIEEAEAQLTRK